MLGYTWPIFFSLVFVKPKSIIKKLPFWKLNYKIFYIASINNNEKI